jgi:hypothetical protein
MTASDGSLEFWTAISDAHWTVTSYDQAMQFGATALRRSSQLSSKMAQGEISENWIRLGQHHALEAAAWFAFARERREAELGAAAGDPVGPLDRHTPIVPPNTPPSS